MVLAIVDTGPLYAAADIDDADHASCLETLSLPDFEWIIPSLVIVEAAYLVGIRLGPKTEAKFLRGLMQFEIESPSVDDWNRIAQLVEQYADFPLGTVDACVIAIAERMGATHVVTLDNRHFRAVRPRHCKAFKILPTGV